ncbi:MAG: low-specificity L-threonine aldolase, partial [Anaerolineae bacterium]|nr:low-specificity L-threonine aldolase [Anaerolineae bacterium]
TPAMRQAMFTAELGDDVYGEDPTVNRLEATAASKLGKEAALFVPSGTMANLASLLAHCQRGDEAIMGHLAHTFLFEAGGSAAVGGIHPRTVQNRADGTLDLDEVEGAIRTDNPHYPRTRLICLENTHNRCSGAVLTPSYMAETRKLADRYGLAIHLDGARIFNAAIALGVPPVELARHADSVSFCLSKGLSAPVGSLICGSEAFIQGAHRQRKLLGGGMRQAGVLAAAGIVALETMVDRLAIDHDNAHRLATGLARLPGIVLDLDRVQTNIVIFELDPSAPGPGEFVSGLAEQGVRMGAIGGRRLRAVTHYGIEATDIDRAVSAANVALKATG